MIVNVLEDRIEVIPYFIALSSAIKKYFKIAVSGEGKKDVTSRSMLDGGKVFHDPVVAGQALFQNLEILFLLVEVFRNSDLFTSDGKYLRYWSVISSTWVILYS